jgi:hypothetical protein
MDQNSLTKKLAKAMHAQPEPVAQLFDRRHPTRKKEPMNRDKIDMADLLQRLERLERQNRAWKFVGLLVLALLAVAGLAGAAVQAGVADQPQPAVPEISVAREFKLLDKDGKMRARMYMTNDSQPAFSLFDEKGKERIYMHINKNGSRFVCLDLQGRHGMSSLGADEKGGIISLLNPANQLRFAANANGAFASQKFFVGDEKGRDRVRLEVTEQGASVTCTDPSGKIILSQMGGATARGGFATFRDLNDTVVWGISDKGVFQKK